MTIKVTKLTGVDLLRKANSFTSGKDSHMSLSTAYRHSHSPIRTQLFWAELTDIPLFVASQFVRSHVGVQFFQLSKRTERGGADFVEMCRNIDERLNDILADVDEGKTFDREAMIDIQGEVLDLTGKFDRYAPTDLAFIVNAESLMNMAHKRLCSKDSRETREIYSKICEEVKKCDQDLYMHLVPQCIYRGGICPEPKSCKWIENKQGQKALEEYKQLF